MSLCLPKLSKVFEKEVLRKHECHEQNNDGEVVILVAVVKLSYC